MKFGIGIGIKRTISDYGLNLIRMRRNREEIFGFVIMITC
jgi:hypothetical protein